MTTVALPPVPQKIGVFGNYFAQPGFNTLVLKEKIMSLSGDSFDIRMKETGQPIIKVQGKVIGSKKTASDSLTNQHLWTMGREYMHLHTTYALKDANGAVVLEVRSGLFTRECCPFFSAFAHVCFHFRSCLMYSNTDTFSPIQSLAPKPQQPSPTRTQAGPPSSS